LNLAINARDAMPDGGVIRFSTRCEGTDVVVRVSDPGTGIEREMLSKIIDPFFYHKGQIERHRTGSERRIRNR